MWLLILLWNLILVRGFISSFFSVVLVLIFNRLRLLLYSRRKYMFIWSFVLIFIQFTILVWLKWLILVILTTEIFFCSVCLPPRHLALVWTCLQKLLFSQMSGSLTGTSLGGYPVENIFKWVVVLVDEALMNVEYVSSWLMRRWSLLLLKIWLKGQLIV